MKTIQQVQTLDFCDAKIVKDGNRFFLETYTSDGEALLKHMADARKPVCVTPTSCYQANH